MSTNDSVATDESIKFSSRVQVVISLYVTPVVVTFGIVGNVLNILILTQKGGKSLSTMVLLCALSFMDLLVLVVQAPHILMSYFERFHDVIVTFNVYYMCYVR